MGVAEYPSGECVWTATVPSGYSPHSIEYLPNGNVAVALTGAGDVSKAFVRVYAASVLKNSTVFAEMNLPSAHAVMWDDENDVLWAMGSDTVAAYEIGGTKEKPTMNRINELGGKLSTDGGHDLSLVYGDSTRLWISAKTVWQFNKLTGTFTKTFAGADLMLVLIV